MIMKLFILQYGLFKVIAFLNNGWDWVTPPLVWLRTSTNLPFFRSQMGTLSIPPLLYTPPPPWLVTKSQPCPGAPQTVPLRSV